MQVVIDEQTEAFIIENVLLDKVIGGFDMKQEIHTNWKLMLNISRKLKWDEQRNSDMCVCFIVKRFILIARLIKI